MGWTGSEIVLFAQDAGQGGGQIFTVLMPFAAIGILFYFMLIRPQKRQERQRRSMLDQLKKNDHVVTAGGILGIVTSLRPEAEEVTIRVDESLGTKLRVTRSSIVRVITAESDGEKSAGN